MPEDDMWDDADYGWCPYCVDTVRFPGPGERKSLRGDVFCSRCSKWLRWNQVLDGELSPDAYVPVSIGRNKLGWASVEELQNDTPESPERVSRRCPKCNKRVQKTADYCYRCGIRLDSYCPNPKCKTKVQKTADYCYRCGHHLKS